MGSCPFLPVLDSTLQRTSGRHKQGLRRWSDETLITGLVVQQRSHPHYPQLGEAQEGLSSSSFAVPHVSAYKGIDHRITES